MPNRGIIGKNRCSIGRLTWHMPKGRTSRSKIGNNRRTQNLITDIGIFIEKARIKSKP